MFQTREDLCTKEDLCKHDWLAWNNKQDSVRGLDLTSWQAWVRPVQGSLQVPSNPFGSFSSSSCSKQGREPRHGHPGEWRLQLLAAGTCGLPAGAISCSHRPSHSMAMQRVTISGQAHTLVTGAQAL